MRSSNQYLRFYKQLNKTLNVGENSQAFRGGGDIV